MYFVVATVPNPVNKGPLFGAAPKYHVSMHRKRKKAEDKMLEYVRASVPLYDSLVKMDPQWETRMRQAGTGECAWIVEM